MTELDARAAAYRIAMALEHVVFAATMKPASPNRIEEAREEFVTAVAPILEAIE